MLSQEVLTQLEKENERDVCRCNIFASLHAISYQLELLILSFRVCARNMRGVWAKRLDAGNPRVGGCTMHVAGHWSSHVCHRWAQSCRRERTDTDFQLEVSRHCCWAWFAGGDPSQPYLKGLEVPRYKERRPERRLFSKAWLVMECMCCCAQPSPPPLTHEAVRLIKFRSPHSHEVDGKTTTSNNHLLCSSFATDLPIEKFESSCQLLQKNLPYTFIKWTASNSSPPNPTAVLSNGRGYYQQEQLPHPFWAWVALKQLFPTFMPFALFGLLRTGQRSLAANRNTLP
jgi:hypothetical protein